MKNLSREQMMESLGTVGEKLVANYLSKNHQVEILYLLSITFYLLLFIYYKLKIIFIKYIFQF